MRTNVQRKCRWLPFWLLACMMSLGATSAWGQAPWRLNASGNKLEMGQESISVTVNATEITISSNCGYSGSELVLPDEVRSVDPNDQTVYHIV
ncbi:hypothetical protein, partial [Parabacteroides sp.]